MISLFRIHERLIHGQVAIKWSRHLDVTHIIVANDSASKNELIQKSLKMAAPSGVKVAIKSVADAIELIKDPRGEQSRILVLVNNPEDALAIVQGEVGITSINVGNYGRVAPEKPGMKRKMYTQNVFCDDEEVLAFKALINTGADIYYQATPENSKQDLNAIFN